MELFEGLHEGDLEGLVLPLISVDEYETKLDDEAVVIAFFVQDRDPANDVNRFIQKGSTEILDTEVSPAPNEDGYYLVFVELMRDADFPRRVMEILYSLNNLTGITKWKGAFNGADGLHDVTEESLGSMTLMAPVEVEEGEEGEEPLSEAIGEFFRHSALNDMWVEGRILHLEGLNESFDCEIIDFGSFEEVREHNAVLGQALRLDENAQRTVRGFNRILGDHWLIEHLENHVLLSQPWSGEDVLLLRL